jgi:hypothetical protein
VSTSTITSELDREGPWPPQASGERPARAAQFEAPPERARLARKRGAAKVRRQVSPGAPAGRAVLCSTRSLKFLGDYAHYRALCKFNDDRRGTPEAKRNRTLCLTAKRKMKLYISKDYTFYTR